MTAIMDTEVLAKSVTKNDAEDSSSSRGIWNFMIYGGGYGVDSGEPILPPTLPAYWSLQRDVVLSRTVLAEGLWAGAVGIAISKLANNSWRVEGSMLSRVRHAHALIKYANNGGGFHSFISKQARDFFTADNGNVFECVWSSRYALSSVLLGIVHLDSRRCIRTGDPEIPIIYRDKKGILHEMKRHQVVDMADMPDSGETWNGIGLCAASRAYPQIYKLATIERYIADKLTGSKALAIHLITGINDKTLQNAITLADTKKAQQGAVMFKGALIIPLITGSGSKVTIPLAEMPDGFERKEEFEIAALVYADSLGIDIQDLQPLMGRSIGTGMQSEVLDDKASEKGITFFVNQMTYALNTWVVPKKTAFSMDQSDLRNSKAKADIRKLDTESVDKWVERGIIDNVAAGHILADMGHLNRRYLKAPDPTPQKTIIGSAQRDSDPSEA